MKAPICAICGKWVSVGEKTGDYISFRPQSGNTMSGEMVRAGHPEGLEMFCNEHFQVARKYKRRWLRRLTWEEARPLIERDIEAAKSLS